MSNYKPSVNLVENRCVGCTDCIKRCPTEAIRVRNGKAKIIHEKCIDCGLCIKVCKNNAKRATVDSLNDVLESKFKIKVALPAPTLYAQFKKVRDINLILTALKKLGFDEVFEVAMAAEYVTEASKVYMEEHKEIRPIISTACPAIVRLVQIKFPTLLPHLLPIISPMEMMARIVKDYYKKKGYDTNDVGVFFISPCAAKATNTRAPLVVEESFVDGVVPINEVYKKMLTIIKKIDEVEILKMSNMKGVNWARIGGECEALGIGNRISVDGIENVMNIFESLENGELEDVEFIEALACTGGCLGGPLTIENSFVAKNRMNKILNKPDLLNKNREIPLDNTIHYYDWEKTIDFIPALKLDDDLEEAMKKMEQIENIYNKLPKIDCGSCGAPTCRALAEDIVLGYANIEDCVFMLREKVRLVAQDMVKLSEKMPPSIRK